MVHIMNSEIGSSVTHRFADVRNQYLTFVIVNFLTLAHGATNGWISPIILILQSENSPLDSGPITNDEMSWLGSIMLLGSVTGNFLIAIINNYFGRKASLIVVAIPNIISWIIVLAAPQIEYLYAARFLSGLTAGGIFICMPLFISEVSSDHIRGSVGSFFVIAINVGTLFSYVAGPYVPYFVLPYIIVAFPILYLIGASFLPDVPLYLMKCGKVSEAEKSVRFYHNCKNNSKIQNERFEIEMKKIVDISNKRKLNEKITLKDFWTPEARRGILNSFTIMTIYILSGPYMFLSYAAPIFAESGSNFDPNFSAIIMIAAQIVGVCISIFTADRFGRKSLIAFSAGGGSIGLFVMGLFIYLFQNGYDMTYVDWLPVVSLSFGVFFFALGLTSLGVLVATEVIPSKIRPIAASISMIQMSLVLFVVAKFFPVLYPIIGMYSCMWFFALVSLFTVFYSLFILPETKGQNINE